MVELEFQVGAQITADRRYDSQVDQDEYASKFTTLKVVCAKRGRYWEDTQDQWLDEQKRLQDRAAEIGVDLTKIPQAGKSSSPLFIQQSD